MEADQELFQCSGTCPIMPGAPYLMEPSCEMGPTASSRDQTSRFWKRLQRVQVVPASRLHWSPKSCLKLSVTDSGVVSGTSARSVPVAKPRRGLFVSDASPFRENSASER